MSPAWRGARADDRPVQIGGALTTDFSWRWIFYINLPIGAVALVVLAVTFPSFAHRIDYLGSALLAAALAALVLMVRVGGTTFPWVSIEVIGLAAATVVGVAAFLLVERRAADPVLPSRLLTNDVFVSAGIVAILVGLAMLGAIAFLPLYFQVVKGESPTGSGLRLLPLMAALSLTSIVVGQIVGAVTRHRKRSIAFSPGKPRKRMVASRIDSSNIARSNSSLLAK